MSYRTERHVQLLSRSAHMAEEPFLALKVGPYSCFCIYNTVASSRDITGHGDEEGELLESFSSAEHDALVPTRRERERVDPAGPADFERRGGYHPSSPSSPSSLRDGLLAAARSISGNLLAGGSGEQFGHLSPSHYAALAKSAVKRLTGSRDTDPDADQAESGIPPRMLSRESQHDLLPRRLLAHSKSLDWVEKVFRKIWPKVDTALHKLVKERVEAKIQDLSPALRGVYFKSFTLGRQVPTFRSVEVFEAPCSRGDEERQGLELHLDIALEAASDKDNFHIELADSYTKIVAGVKSLTVKGELVIRLDPLLQNFPIVGGIVVYFRDPPKIEPRFEGLAKIADFALLQGSVRSIINGSIAEILVLPNVLHVPLVQDESVVDSAVLKDPKPAGVLRVTAIRARNLTGVDWHFLSKATSDPYLRLMLSADEWSSSVVYKTCDPDWPEHECKDFLVYDREQKLRISVHDWGPMKSHDLIGQARPYKILEVLEQSEKPIPLLDPLADLDGKGLDHTPQEQQRGEVTLRFEWLHITPEHETEDGAIVRVKFDELYLPTCINVNRVAISARLGQNKKTTKAVKARAKPAVAPDRAEADENHDANALVFEIEHVLNLTLPPGAEPGKQVLELAVVDARQKVLGTCTVDLADVADAYKKTKTWAGRGRMHFAHSKGGLPANSVMSADVVISWLGLQKASLQDVKAHFDQLLPGTVRSSEQCESPAARSPPVSPGVQSLTAVGATLPVSDQPRHFDSLEWVNQMFGKLWPKLVNLIGVYVEHPDSRINQKMRAKMPGLLKNMHFSRFQLGPQSPSFKLKQVRDAPERLGQAGMQGLELHLEFVLGSAASDGQPGKVAKNSDIEIDLGVAGLKLGVRSFRMSGEMVVRFEPLLQEVPVIGGMVICCLNRPRVEMEFSGLAAQMVDRGLEGNLRGLIDWGISSCLVMPNVMGMPIGSESQGVDRALLRLPKLLGVLRVRILGVTVQEHGAGILEGLFNLGQCSSRRHLRLTLADELHNFGYPVRACGAHDADDSEEDEKDENGQDAAADNVWDFPVYDERQQLEIELVDKCWMDTVVAKAEPLVIDKAVATPGTQVELKRHLDDEAGKGRRQRIFGTVRLRCELLHVKLGSRGQDEWSMVRVKVDEAFVPAPYLLPDTLEDSHRLLGLGASIVARVGDVEKVSPLAKYYLRDEASQSAGVSKSFSELKQMGSARLELEVEFVLYLPVRNEDLNKAELEIGLRSKTRGPVGSASLPLAEVLKNQELKYEDSKLRIPGPDGADSEVMIVVNIMGLERARRTSVMDLENSRR